LSNFVRPSSNPFVITRSDIVWLGVSAGVTGSLIGGMMLGIGMDLIVNGQVWGWLLLLPAAPASALPGWLLARKLTRQL
jgi:hypothetical protein